MSAAVQRSPKRKKDNLAAAHGITSKRRASRSKPNASKHGVFAAAISALGALHAQLAAEPGICIDSDQSEALRAAYCSVAEQLSIQKQLMPAPIAPASPMAQEPPRYRYEADDDMDHWLDFSSSPVSPLDKSQPSELLDSVEEAAVDSVEAAAVLNCSGSDASAARGEAGAGGTQSSSVGRGDVETAASGTQRGNESPCWTGCIVS